MPFEAEAKDIQFGLKHSIILTSTGKVFVVGALKHFKDAPHDIIDHNGTELLILHLSSPILQIASGQNHFILLNERNEINGFGCNKFNQCLKVTPSEKVTKIASGWTHNVFLTAANELFLYGRNNYGQLGNGHRDEFRSVYKCPIHPVSEVKVGAEHVIIKSDKEIYTFGWNEHGNCGNGSFEDLCVILRPLCVKVLINSHLILDFNRLF